MYFFSYFLVDEILSGFKGHFELSWADKPSKLQSDIQLANF